MTASDTRGELGSRFDDLTMLDGMPLILRGRLAWAHDWVSDPSLTAGFQALPGSTFIVYGAPIPHDSALTTAGAESRINSNWSVLGNFDGDFASGSQTYSGSGTVRYTW
jgi:outer membrane autotransporter protein